MLKKVNRLSVFRVNGKQQVFDTPLFKIKIFSMGGGETKIRFTVSKKIDKRAVYRNKTKRVLSKGVEEILPKINKGFAIIFIAKKTLESKDQEFVNKEQKKVFEKAGIYK